MLQPAIWTSLEIANVLMPSSMQVVMHPVQQRASLSYHQVPVEFETM